MKCPISGLDCQRAEVKLVDGRVISYQCVEHSNVAFVLFLPEAMERIDAALARAEAIIAAQRGDERYGIGG